MKLVVSEEWLDIDEYKMTPREFAEKIARGEYVNPAIIRSTA